MHLKLSPVLALAAATLLVTGCDTESNAPLTVEVYPNIERCVVKEQAVRCASVGKYLREELKIGRNRQINISMYRMDKNHTDREVKYVANVVRVAGFNDVQVWQFGFQ
ncbi:MAG: hypothetical protein H7Y02_04030 [Candidatus Obscuribacterales bacterium]|nr:hypothetical protein [Steroidobacteraceae bacterium]